jgi:hypothetical protein
MLLPADRQSWNRGPGRRLVADRGVQLEFPFMLDSATSANVGVDGRTPIESRRSSSVAGDSSSHLHRPETAHVDHPE